jgi:hypothetical protein
MECRSLASGWAKDWGQSATVITSFRPTGRNDWVSYRVFWADKRGTRRPGYYWEPMDANGSLLPFGGPFTSLDAAQRATWAHCLSVVFENNP